MLGRLRTHVHVLHDIASIYGVQFANYLLPLVTVPYLARVLGPTSWGLIAMAQALALYCSLIIEYGFIYSATREIVTASTADQIEAVIAGVSGAKTLLAALVTIGACCAYVFVPLFHQHPLLLWIAVASEILKSSIPSYYFYGQKRIAVASSLEVAARMTAGIGIFFFVHRPEDGWKFFGLQAAGAFVAAVIGHALILARYRLRWPTMTAAVRMIRQGSDMFLLRSAHNIYSLGNAFILGLFVSPQAVGYYAGAEKINTAAAGLLSPLSTALYPRAAGLVKTSLPKAALLTRLSLYAMLAVALALSCIMWFGAPLIIRIFLGRNFAESIGVLRILSLRTPLIAFMNVLGFQWLLALGLERSFQRVTLVTLSLNVVLATLFAPKFSYTAMAWCVVASQTVAVLGVLLVLERRKLNPLFMPADATVPEPAPLQESATEPASDAPSCAVLVMSSDGYRDLWAPFFTLFWRYWPDCPFPVYLGSNRTRHSDPRVTTLLTGDYPWSKTLRLCLEQMDANYVLLLLEDFFLSEPVDSAAVERSLRLLHRLQGRILRIYPRPAPNTAVPGLPDIGRIHPLAPFRVSLQPAIWNRLELLKIARDNESIWDFEVQGTERSRADPDGYYATFEPALQYRHVVERGKWMRSAIRVYAREPIGCDWAARPVVTRARTVIRFFNAQRREVIYALQRRKMQNHT